MEIKGGKEGKKDVKKGSGGEGVDIAWSNL